MLGPVLERVGGPERSTIRPDVRLLLPDPETGPEQDDLDAGDDCPAAESVAVRALRAAGEPSAVGLRDVGQPTG